VARIRTVKPEFWSSEDVAAVSRDARLLFIALLNFADDSGNGPGSVGAIKIKVYPGDNDVTPSKIAGWLGELDRELLSLYDFEGKKFYHVNKFLDHQRIDKPQKPKYPPFQERSKNGQIPFPPDSKGKDRKEGKRAPKPAQPMLEVYITQKKRKLSGADLSAFNIFWTAFDYKHDRARAADAWLDIVWPSGRDEKNALF